LAEGERLHQGADAGLHEDATAEPHGYLLAIELQAQDHRIGRWLEWVTVARPPEYGLRFGSRCGFRQPGRRLLRRGLLPFG
jgi:hypothetical protein